jgi:hypothetical protein
MSAVVMWEFEHRNKLNKTILFILTIWYQVGIFKALSTYLILFTVELPMEHTNSGEERLLQPFHMENVIQFWVLIEIASYASNIIALIITLAVSSCLGLKKMVKQDNDE